METIVLDYSEGDIIILKHDRSEDVEEMLIDNGFGLQNCEWMTVKKVRIKRN